MDNELKKDNDSLSYWLHVWVIGAMPFQCPTLGACLHGFAVGNYICFSRASPSRASTQASPSRASTQACPIEFGEGNAPDFAPPPDDTRLVLISLYHTLHALWTWMCQKWFKKFIDQICQNLGLLGFWGTTIHFIIRLHISVAMN